MDRTAAIRHRVIPGRQWVHHRQWLVGVGLWVILATLVLATVETTRNAGGVVPADDTAAMEQAEWIPAPELPRQWRRERKAITFDHMYRQKESPGQIDWVRDASHLVPGGVSDVGRSPSRR